MHLVSHSPKKRSPAATKSRAIADEKFSLIACEWEPRAFRGLRKQRAAYTALLAGLAMAELETYRDWVDTAERHYVGIPDVTLHLHHASALLAQTGAAEVAMRAAALRLAGAAPGLQGDTLQLAASAMYGQSAAPSMVLQPPVSSRGSAGALAEGESTIGDPPDPPDHYVDAGLRTMRRGGLAGVGLIFLSVLLLLVSSGLGLMGMFAGLAIFSLANYTAYRRGESGWIMGPSFASRVFSGSLFLALVAGVAALTGVERI
jgi:hypothetical protein